MTSDTWSIIIGALGVLVTGYFSYQIANANKKSAEAAEGATKAAEESAKISKLMLDIQETQKAQMRKQTINDLISKLWLINTFTGVIIKEKLYSVSMEKLPQKINISNMEIASYFTDEEQEILNKLIFSFEMYRIEYFENGKPRFSVDDKYIKHNNVLFDLSLQLINLLNATIEN